MGVDEENLQVKDVDVVLENCPITIPLRYILTSSDYGVYNSHYLIYIYYICDRRSKRHLSRLAVVGI